MTGIYFGQLRQARKEATLNFQNGDEMVEAQPKEDDTIAIPHYVEKGVDVDGNSEDDKTEHAAVRVQSA